MMKRLVPVLSAAVVLSPLAPVVVVGAYNQPLSTLLIGGKLVASATAPTFTSGACSGAIVTANNTAAFTFKTGSGSCGSTATLAMPAASNGWVCDAVDEAGGGAFRIQETTDSPTSVVFTGFSIGSTPAVATFTASHTVKVKCSAY